MRTMPVFGNEISLTLPSTAVWLCVSMMPGRTNLPVASMTCAPAGMATEAFGPTAAIFEPRISTVPCSILPCVMVRMVASWMAMTFSARAAAAVNAMRMAIFFIAPCSR